MQNEDIIKNLAETSARSKSNQHRLDRVEKRQSELGELVASVSAIATEQTAMRDNISEIKTDIKEIKEKPSRRWDAVVDKVVMTFLGGVLLYIMSKIGL